MIIGIECRSSSRPTIEPARVITTVKTLRPRPISEIEASNSASSGEMKRPKGMIVRPMVIAWATKATATIHHPRKGRAIRPPLRLQGAGPDLPAPQR